MLSAFTSSLYGSILTPQWVTLQFNLICTSLKVDLLPIKSSIDATTIHHQKKWNNKKNRNPSCIKKAPPRIIRSSTVYTISSVDYTVQTFCSKFAKFGQYSPHLGFIRISILTILFSIFTFDFQLMLATCRCLGGGVSTDCM